jgi:hypothetical protein
MWRWGFHGYSLWSTWCSGKRVGYIIVLIAQRRRRAIFQGSERKRLYKEARDFLSLRAKRKKYVADQRAGVLEIPSARAEERV